MSQLEEVSFYQTQYGLWPIPVPYGEKGPRIKGWTDLYLDTPEKLALHFANGRRNVALRLGEPHYATDVDVDTAEAYWPWMTEYALDTGMRWGHGQMPAAHSLYYLDQPLIIQVYDDPLLDGEKARLIELRGLSKDGKPGLVSIVPPSRHPSGELYEFYQNKIGAPALVAAGELERAVRYTAAAALLGRRAPPQGRRHDFFLALAGILARNNWAEEEARKLVRAIYRVLWQNSASLDAAEAEVDSTYERFEHDRETTGGRTLKDLLDPKVFERAAEWLEWKTPLFEEAPRQTKTHSTRSNGQAGAAAAPAPEPKVFPTTISADDLQRKILTKPDELITGFLTRPGLTVIVAPSKAGKSLLTMQMAMCIANCQSLLANYTTQQAGALYIEWDDPSGETSCQNLLNIARNSRPGQPLHFVFRPAKPITISDPEFGPWLREQIRRTPNCGLVVIDSYSASRGYHNAGKDIVKVEADELMLLSDIAIQMHCAILLIHHDSKTAAHLDEFSRGAGSYAMNMVPVGQMYLQRIKGFPESDGSRRLTIRGRDRRGSEMILRLKEDSLDFDLVLTGPASQIYRELRDLWLLYRDKSFTIKDVYQDLGWSRTTAYSVLSRLVMAEVLRKANTSTWEWNPDFYGKEIR